MRRHRNLLVVLASGFRADAFGGAGAWPITTPHLDAFADYGLALTAVTASPAATPSLLSLFSGLHPRQHGLMDDGLAAPPLTTWVSQLAGAGYHTVGVGRLKPAAGHFHQTCAVADLAITDPGACPYLTYMRGRGMIARIMSQRQRRLRSGPFDMPASGVAAPGDDIDGFIAQQAIGVLEHMPHDRPWLLVVSFTGPGNDLPAPTTFFHAVTDAGVKRLSSGFVPADMRTLDRYVESPYPRTILQRLNAASITQLRRHYLGRALLIDQGVGHLRDALVRHDHAETTWTLLTADRGKLLGERGAVGERSLLGPAVTVPLWLLPPDGFSQAGIEVDPATVSHELVSTVDVAPTICAIAGLDPPRGAAGQSLLPALRGEAVGRPCAISEYGTRLLLETLQHRAVFDTESEQPRSIFDLMRDPDERRDLLDTPEGLALIDMLRWQLAGALMRMRPVRLAS